jgi:hypothetical protein
MTQPSCKCLVFDNPGLCGLYRSRASTLWGYPSRGITVGEVPAGPEHWNPNAYGWTQQQAPILKHPTENLWATPYVIADTASCEVEYRVCEL